MREPIATWTFALTVVRRGHRFLLVHERKHGQLWYLPAGRVEPGESLVEGARRETLEESGVPVRIDGIYRIEHSPRADHTCRMRIFFAATPIDDTPPLSHPNEHSLEAGWFSIEEMAKLDLRGDEVIEVCRAVANGFPACPLSLLTFEGAPWPNL
jgi:phosphatase NudJ